MNVSEKAKAGRTNADVAAAQGGAAPVSDKTEQVSSTARFWCKGKGNQISGGGEMGFDIIRFKDWVFECPSGSPEAKALRQKDVWARFGVAEVLAGPYADEAKRVDFIMFLETLMYSGVSQGDGISREGRDSVIAMLLPEDGMALARKERNTPRALARAVSAKMSLNVESFGTEG